MRSHHLKFAIEKLGRGIVLSPKQQVPSPWRGLDRLVIDEGSVIQPSPTLEKLHKSWLHRRPVIVELKIDKNWLKTPEAYLGEAYSLSYDFEFRRERIHFLIWANSYDATLGLPIWWYRRLALRGGCQPHPEAEVDLDGPIWCDGGPRGDLRFPVLHRESILRGTFTLTRPLEVPAGALSQEQVRATAHTVGAATVIAPAGSGKTRVLTSRMRALTAAGIEGPTLTCLAYNRRAAGEMNLRLGDTLSRDSVKTIHAFGYELLKRFGGIRMAEPTELEEIHSELETQNLSPNKSSLPHFTSLLGKVRLELREPAQFDSELSGFSRKFHSYREALKKRAIIDYEEQVYGAIELLLRCSRARKVAQSMCTHLQVDEFQDLTPAYLLLVRLLAAPAYQLFAVGDDDQVIYGYAGATPKFLLEFSKLFPAAVRYQLCTNYRCPKGVVSEVDRLLRKNRLRFPKRIRGKNPSRKKPRVLLKPPGDWQASAVSQIRTWLKNFPPEEIVVLVRTNPQLGPLKAALATAGISFQSRNLNEPAADGIPGYGITLSSIHRVKGLEWDCVLLYGADVGLLPHHLSQNMEEERRLFHVALTRCKKELTIIASPQRLSPFLREMKPLNGLFAFS